MQLFDGKIEVGADVKVRLLCDRTCVDVYDALALVVLGLWISFEAKQRFDHIYVLLLNSVVKGSFADLVLEVYP